LFTSRVAPLRQDGLQAGNTDAQSVGCGLLGLCAPKYSRIPANQRPRCTKAAADEFIRGGPDSIAPGRIREPSYLGSQSWPRFIHPLHSASVDRAAVLTHDSEPRLRPALHDLRAGLKQRRAIHHAGDAGLLERLSRWPMQ
jgi:hypothetical protein